jgi:hypothetical protein
MSLLEDIRKQPRHIREAMFALSVVTTVSLVGVLWFQSFEKTLYVTMNPEPQKQEQFFVERGLNQPSLMGNIGGAFQKSWTDLKAAFLSTMGKKEIVATPTPEIKNIQSDENIYRFPLPAEK